VGRGREHALSLAVALGEGGDMGIARARARAHTHTHLVRYAARGMPAMHAWRAALTANMKARAISCLWVALELCGTPSRRRVERRSRARCNVWIAMYIQLAEILSLEEFFVKGGGGGKKTANNLLGA